MKKLCLAVLLVCEALGGHIATITTPEENALFPNIMKAKYVTNYYYWLGGVQVSGAWQWVNGEVFSCCSNNEPDSVDAVVGLAFTHSFTASGTPPFEWKLDYVPEGFSFDSVSGTLTGTAKSTGYSEFVVHVSNMMSYSSLRA